VRPRHGLGDDPLHSHVGEQRGREDACLDIRADRDDGGRKVRCADLAHRVLVGRVRFDDMREDVGVILNAPRVGIDAEHLVTELYERPRERAAEAAEPDDEELPFPSQ
jgi:hypothetical protein